ncbi:rCG43379 [Rattus norvegicus]|uniref:RCG43379 n=1 Tax=Rattus norvegicus TaxID=10116 RepID=A6IWM1_RAT|nr:rCG43379 [Rattus norvegicus]
MVVSTCHCSIWSSQIEGRQTSHRQWPL